MVNDLKAEPVADGGVAESPAVVARRLERAKERADRRRDAVQGDEEAAVAPSGLGEVVEDDQGAFEDADPLSRRLRKLEVEVRRLWIRNGHTRNKLFAMQQVVVEGMGRTEAHLGTLGSDIFPVETKRDASAPVRVLVFASQGVGMGIAPKQFFSTFEGRHCEIFFFKDFRQCWYQRGLLGLANDVPSTVEYLKGLLGDDPRPLATIGASSGGFAALLFGALLGAKKIVAFSPQSIINERIFNRFKSEDSILEDIELDSKYANLPNVLSEHPLKGTANIYFSRRAPHDAEEAQRLEPFSGVVLNPLEWNGHNVARLLRSDGKLDGIIEDLATP